MIDYSIGTGLETVQIEAFAVLFRDLNTALAQIEAIGQNVRDARISEIIGSPVPATTLEQVDSTPRIDSPGGNFYLGHRASLINAPITQYPNVSVISDDSTNFPAAEWDQGNAFRNRLRVEIMVKSEAGEDEVNKRVQRMTDAVNAALMASRDLTGAVGGELTMTRTFIGNVFPRKADTSYGENWYWQGARLDYSITKVAADPSPFNGDFYAAGIDQS